MTKKLLLNQQIIICDKNAILVNNVKKIESIPVEVNWVNESEHSKNVVELKLIDTPIVKSQSFVLDSGASYGDGGSCSQFITIFDNHIINGPSFCVASEGLVREFKVQKKGSQIQVAIVDSDQDLSDVAMKTTTSESEVWTWQNKKWEKTFEKKSDL